MLTGGAIGAVVPQTGAASALALFSHYTIDHIPHWNYLPKYRTVWEDTWKMGLEPLITVPIFFALAWYFNWGAEIIVPAIAATIPDVIEATQFFLKSKILRYHTRWHHFGHWHARFLPALPMLLTLLAIVVWLLPFDIRN